MKEVNMFTVINDILFYKKGDLLDSEANERFFVPWMVNRYLSCYAPECVVFVNDILNKQSISTLPKKQQYLLYLKIVPKLKYKKISYIKQSEKEDSSEIKYENLSKLLEDELDISSDDVKYLLETMDQSQLKLLEKQLK